MAAAFEDINEADKVALHVCMRIFKTVAHTRLSGQMNDPVKFMIGKEPLHALPVRQVQEDKPEPVEWFEPLKTRLFQPHIVVAVQIVQSDDPVSVIEKTPAQMKTDKAGGPGDENTMLNV